jgi:hypothetical protein
MEILGLVLAEGGHGHQAEATQHANRIAVLHDNSRQ